MATLEIQITKTEVFEKLLSTNANTIKLLAEGMNRLAEGDTQGAQQAILDSILALGNALNAGIKERGVTPPTNDKRPSPRPPAITRSGNSG